MTELDKRKGQYREQENMKSQEKGSNSCISCVRDISVYINAAIINILISTTDYMSTCM